MASRTDVAKATSAATRTARAGGPLPSVDPAEIEALRRDLAAARLERDDYRQEMFESNRYAAWLTHQARDMTHVAPQKVELQNTEIDDVPEYAAYLEDRLWAAETERLRTMGYVRYLEEYCWELETRRVAAANAAASQRD